VCRLNAATTATGVSAGGATISSGDIARSGGRQDFWTLRHLLTAIR
jgi:hypothetical protein